MKNHELLDLIGEVREDYVQAADQAVRRRPVPWRGWAAAAACAALIVAAYPLSRAFPPQADPHVASTPDCVEPTPDPLPRAEDSREPVLVQRPGLHEYTLVERDVRIIPTQGEEKIPGGSGIDVPGQDAPEPNPDGAQPPRGDGPDPVFGEVPAQEVGGDQCSRLYAVYQSVGADDPMLKWFGGAWVNQPDGMTVAVVEGYRNQALERQIEELAGADGEGPAVVYVDVKYSQRFLDGLMDEITRIFEELEVHISSAYGVDVMDNYLGLDFFGAVPSDEALAALALLDPDGDALRIQVFYDGSIQLTDEAAKGPAGALEAEPTPVPMEEGEYSAVPGGAREDQTAKDPAEDMEQETSQPASDPSAMTELPQAKYDVISGTKG